VANWRREREGVAVHVLPETAIVALCELDRVRLGSTIWEAGIAARDLCVKCSRRMLWATAATIRVTENLATVAEREAAREALRGLQRVVPVGETRNLITYARACLASGALTGAHESVKRWRANMRAIGVFVQDD